MTYAEPMEKYSGTPIEAHEAWQMFERWKNRGQDIGVIFCGRSANVYTIGTVASLANGRLEINGAFARASFNLTGASFKYGPMETGTSPQKGAPEITSLGNYRSRAFSALIPPNC